MSEINVLIAALGDDVGAVSAITLKVIIICRGDVHRGVGVFGRGFSFIAGTSATT